jgi:hypothetical protein
MGSWREGTTNDPDFAGQGKIEIEITRLVKHHAGADRRERARRKTADVTFSTAAPLRSARTATSRPAATRPAAVQPVKPEAEEPPAGEEQ